MATQFISRTPLCASERTLRSTRTGAVSPRTEPLISVEPPCTNPYARWYGREGAVRPLPIPIHAGHPFDRTHGLFTLLGPNAPCVLLTRLSRVRGRESLLYTRQSLSGRNLEHGSSPTFEYCVSSRGLRGPSISCLKPTGGRVLVYGGCQLVMKKRFKKLGSGMICASDISFQLVAEAHEFINLCDDTMLLGKRW